MMIRFPVEVSALLFAAAVVALPGCSAEPTTCAEADCDPATTYCRVMGSDIAGEPSRASCHPWPAACADAPTCDCLLEAEGVLDLGTCTEEEGAFSVIIPGG